MASVLSSFKQMPRRGKVVSLIFLLFLLLVTVVTVYQVGQKQLFQQQAMGYCIVQADGTLLCKDTGCTEDAQCAFGRSCAGGRCVGDPQPTIPGTLTTETGADCPDPAGGYGWSEYCNLDRCHWGCSEISCGGGACIVPTPIPSGVSYTEGSHMECVNNRCAKVEGSGINESGCLPGSQTTQCGYTHLDCIEGKCVESAPGVQSGDTGFCMRGGSTCSGPDGVLLLACSQSNKSDCQSMRVANACDCQCVRPGFSCEGCTVTNYVCPTAKPGSTGNENLYLGGSAISTPTPIPARTSTPGSCMNGDVNGDGVVNIIDIGIVIDYYGK